MAEAEAAAAAGGGGGGGGQVAGDLQYEGKKEDAKVTLLPKKNVDQDSSSKLKSQSFFYAKIPAFRSLFDQVRSWCSNV